MKRIVMAIGFLVLFRDVAQAGHYFYWADFAPPLNQPGYPPAVGQGPRTPTSINFGTPTVVGSYDQITNYALLFSAIGLPPLGEVIHQVQFDLARQAPNYFVDFDFETHDLVAESFDYSIDFDNPGTDSFNLRGGIGIYAWVPPYTSPTLPAWGDDQLHHMHLLWDIAHSSWTLQLDDRPPLTWPIYPEDGQDVLDVRFTLENAVLRWPANPYVQVALSKVRIGTLAPAPPPVISWAGPPPSEYTNCTVTLNVAVQDSSTSPLTVIWSVDGTPGQTNTLPEGTALTPVNVAYGASFGPGAHVVSVLATNGEGGTAGAATQFTVRDNTPPTILDISAAPNRLWPPNRQMVSVNIAVNAVDDCGLTASRIIAVRSTARAYPPGSLADWQITGDLSLNLRAELGAVYTVLLECSDSSGNSTQGTITIPLSHNP